MDILRIRFVDGSQIDFRDVKDVVEDKDDLQFNYIDSSLNDQRVTICIRLSSIIFLIKMRQEEAE